MTNKLLWLFAFICILGVACKKDSTLSPDQVNQISKNAKVAVVDKENPPGGESTFPHNTGACYCGKYPGCHPTTYYDGHGYGHATLPGQTTFPPGSTFPGNNPN